MDGVFDLFHVGHLKAIEKCYTLGSMITDQKKELDIEDECNIIIGVISDEDTESYKRPPIISLDERSHIIRSLKHVDRVISPSPLIVTRKFIKENKIDIVVHAFADDEDFENQKDQHKELIEMGIFQRIPYTSDISTTGILKKIRRQKD